MIATERLPAPKFICLIIYESASSSNHSSQSFIPVVCFLSNAANSFNAISVPAYLPALPSTIVWLCVYVYECVAALFSTRTKVSVSGESSCSVATSQTASANTARLRFRPAVRTGDRPVEGLMAGSLMRPPPPPPPPPPTHGHTQPSVPDTGAEPV